jgi:hypothetical protein
MNASAVLRIIALICFVLAAFGVAAFGVALVPAGLAFWVASTLC